MRNETYDYMKGFIKGRFPTENLHWRVDKVGVRLAQLCIISLDDIKLSVQIDKATVVYESDYTTINSFSGLSNRDLEEMIKTLKPV